VSDFLFLKRNVLMRYWLDFD